MASFNIARELTGVNEGGYKIDADDTGDWTSGVKGHGELIGTKYGISAPVLSDYLKRPATITDMNDLTQDIASLIYKRNYWDKIKGDEINNQQEANSIYDSAVNMGVATAIKLAQQSLNVSKTGVMDIATLNALNNK